MLISENAKAVVELASLVVVAIGVVACVHHLRWFKRALPRAIVHARPRLLRGLRLLPILGLPVGLWGYRWAESHDVEVLVVRDGKSLVYGDRVLERKLARNPIEFPVAAGNEDPDPIWRPTWTVNASSKPIRLVTIDYGKRSDHFVETKVVTILPGQRVGRDEFDFYGNMFEPPESLDKAATYRFSTAMWLTWDP